MQSLASLTAAVVTVQPLPVLTVSPDVTTCLGTPVTLTVSGASTYSWAPPDGLNTTSGPSVIATASFCFSLSVTKDMCVSVAREKDLHVEGLFRVRVFPLLFSKRIY